MTFQKHKKDFLNKKDKSKKGSIDGEIKKLVDKINSLENYYTTSSCSGRILIAKIPDSDKKNEVSYLFCYHKKINFNQIRKIIDEIKNLKEDVWLRMEGAILHIASKTIEDAAELLNTSRNTGFRRSGIIAVRENKISAELISTERIDAIIAKKGKVIIDDSYLRQLIREANSKLEKTHQKINKFYNKIR